MVWLSNAQAFGDFVEQTFEAYEKLNRLDKDVADWQAATKTSKPAWQALNWSMH